MYSDILKFFSLIALTQVVLLTINIIKKRSNSLSRYILILLFIAFGIYLVGNSLFFYIDNKIKYKIAHLMNLTVFLTAPLLILYTKSRLTEKVTLNIKDLYHILPFIIVFSFMFFRLIISNNKFSSFRPYGITLLGMLFMQNLLYFWYIRKKLNNIKNNIESKNNIDQNAYPWINKLFYLFFGILLTQLGVFISCNIFTHIKICTMFTSVFFLITFILINNIVLFGLSDSSKFLAKEKYQNSTINNDIKYSHIKKLTYALENEKVYMDPLLTLDRLSRNTLIPKNLLSQIINEHFGMNFNDLINQYRIDAAKEYLQSGNHSFTIIEIAYEVGFNSKSTFNTAFKRFTGLTPSEFINKQAVLN